MGQSASKAAARWRPKTRFTDPNAVEGGFTRGEGPQQNARDAAQQAFLRAQAGASPQELPDDLLQFLKDVGPLKKSNETKKTRPPRPLSTGSAESRDHQTTMMPLAEQIPGFTTARTTSFSHRPDIVDAKDFGVDELGLYHLLVATRGCTGAALDAAVDAYYQSLTAARAAAAAWTEEERHQHRQRLREAATSIQLPILWVDPEDDTYVGAAEDKTPDLKMLKLQELPPTSVKLVLQDLSEMEQSKTAKG